MDVLLEQEVTEAAIRLRKAIARVVNESPECFTHKNGKWFVEFRNPTSGESIIVTYSGPTTLINVAFAKLRGVFLFTANLPFREQAQSLTQEVSNGVPRLLDDAAFMYKEPE